jgi:hypothetical protein
LFCAPAVIILHGADDGIEKNHCWPPVKKGKKIKLGADNVLARSLPGQQSDFICLFLSIIAAAHAMQLYGYYYTHDG